MPRTPQQWRREVRKTQRRLKSSKERMFGFGKPTEDEGALKGRLDSLLERDAAMRAIGRPYPRTTAERKRVITRLCKDDIVRYIYLYKRSIPDKGGGDSAKKFAVKMRNLNELQDVYARLQDWHEDADRYGIEGVTVGGRKVSLNTSFGSFIRQLGSMGGRKGGVIIESESLFK